MDRTLSLPAGNRRFKQWEGAAGPSLGPLDCPTSTTDKSGQPQRSIFGLRMRSCRGPLATRWALLVLAVDMVYTALLVPISVGFQINDLDWTWACFVDIVAGAVFPVELWRGFHLSFVATSGGRRREVFDGRAVARYYARHGSFLQDALAAGIWTTQLVLLGLHQSGVAMGAAASAFQYVRVVRLVRFASVLRVLGSLAVTGGSGGGGGGAGGGWWSLFRLRLRPAAAHVLSVVYSGIVIVNFFSCLWNFIAIKEGFDNTWMNPVGQLVRRYGAPGASVLTPAELAAVPALRRYLTAFYFSLVTLLTLGYGDIVPSTPIETVVDIVQIAVGVLVFGIILSALADAVTRSSSEARRAQVYRDKMESVEAWLRASPLPKPLKDQVRAFYSSDWVRHAAQARGEGAALLAELPAQLRRVVAWEATRAAATAAPLFSGVEEGLLVGLVALMAPVEVTPGQELCLRGDAASFMWLLVEGEVEVVEGDLPRVRGPAVLGEAALLQETDFSCSLWQLGYRTATACTLWEAPTREVLTYLQGYPAARGQILGAARARLGAQRAALAEAGPRAIDIWGGGGAKGGGGGQEETCLLAGASPDAGIYSGGLQPQPSLAARGEEEATLPGEAEAAPAAAQLGLRPRRSYSLVADGRGAGAGAPELAPAGSSNGADSESELQKLRAEVVGWLEVLAEEVRRLGVRGQLAAPPSRRATTQHAAPPPRHITSLSYNRFQ